MPRRTSRTHRGDGPRAARTGGATGAARRTLAGAVLAAALLAACGDDADGAGAGVAPSAGEAPAATAAPQEGPTDAGTGASEATGATSCDLFDLDEVAAVLGRPAADVETSPGTGFADFCSWIAFDETRDPVVQHYLGLSITDDSAAMWAPELYEGDRQRPVEGFGDEAFVSYGERDGVTAGVVDGDTVAYLTLSISWVSMWPDQPADDTAEREDEVVDLLRLALSRR